MADGSIGRVTLYNIKTIETYGVVMTSGAGPDTK